jgi:transposase-like protein
VLELGNELLDRVQVLVCALKSGPPWIRLLSQMEDVCMSQKKDKPEEIVAKLRQVDGLVSQGRSVSEAVCAISVTPFTYYRWRKKFGGLKGDQVERLKDLGKENERLRKAVSDLTLEKLILKETASGNF